MRWPKDAFKPAAVALVLALIVAGLLIGIVLAVIVVLVMDPAAFSHHGLDGVTAIVSSSAAELPALVAVLLSLPHAAGISLRELGFVRPDLRAIGIALVAVVAGVIVVNLGSSLVSALTHTGNHDQATERLFLGLHSPWKTAIFAIFAVVFAPVAEETVFRAFVFNVGRRYGGFWIGAIVSSILFGLAHGDLYNALPLALVGMVLCGVYAYTRNIFASMIAHGAFNLLSLVALSFFPKIVGG